MYIYILGPTPDRVWVFPSAVGADWKRFFSSKCAGFTAFLKIIRC